MAPTFLMVVLHVLLGGHTSYSLPLAHRHVVVPQLSRSQYTALGQIPSEVPNCTLSRAAVSSGLGRRATQSAYLHTMLKEPFTPQLLADTRLRRLFARPRAASKEISEAYAAAAQVRAVLRARGASSNAVRLGTGLCVFDVCSGKGITSVILSQLLPEASVVMFDSNSAMDLSHVAALHNVRFVELDIFSREAEPTLRGAVARASTCVVAVGMHLCGNLSPRLAVLAGRLSFVHGLVLCPCCIKGSLGEVVKRRARVEKRPNYDVLAEMLSAVCQSEFPADALVCLDEDHSMLSPRNSLITTVKRCGEDAAAAKLERPLHVHDALTNPAIARMLSQYRAI